MLPIIIRRFLRWYDRYDDFNTVFAAFLFSIQLAHLIWLSANVVIPKIFGISPFIENHLFNIFVAIVDYTEIPAIISTSLVYLRSYKRKGHGKDLVYLFFLNIQWLHIFWITDEIILETSLFGNWNALLAWFAIIIDYLELPVIFETLKRAYKVIFR